MDDQILSLYAKGISTRDICATFKELYDACVSPTVISKVTDAVLGRVTEWQSRELEPLYPIVYLDCIVVKTRENQQVIKKSLYLALGVDLEGRKDLLGIWVSENEGAKFWLSVLTDLRSRGVNDILNACVDGLKGFPEAINSGYPGSALRRAHGLQQHELLAMERLQGSHRHPQSDLNDQRNRIAEQWDTKGDSTTKGLSYREICFESGVSGHHGCVKEVDHADSQLETSSESVYYTIW